VGAKVNVIGWPGRTRTVAPASVTVSVVRVSVGGGCVGAGPVGGGGFAVWGLTVPRGTAVLVVVAGVVEIALPAQPAADIETTAITQIRHRIIDGRTRAARAVIAFHRKPDFRILLRRQTRSSGSAYSSGP
jgi:hypothetical protein